MSFLSLQTLNLKFPNSSHSLSSLPSLIPSSLKPKRKSNSKTNKNDGGSRSLRCNPQLLADFAPATSAAYGTLLLGGGVFAYSRSGSKGSIIGGLSGSVLMAVAYYLMQSPETKQAGDAIGFGSAFLFSSVFGIRLAATRKAFPSGLLLLLSIGALTVFYSAYMQDQIPLDINPM